MMTPISVEAVKENIQPKDQNLYFAGQLIRDGGIFFCEYETDEVVFQLSRYSVTFTSKKGLCTQCNEAIEVGDGAVLANCSHLLCRLCMDKSVKIKDGECISCKKVLSPLEICSVLNDEELVVKNFPYRFYCKSEGCTASCFFEDKIDEFCCYRCAHTNCIVCRVQHEGMNCKEYQNMIGEPNNIASRAAVHKIISQLKDGSAIKCPSCATVLVKKYGCKWIRCLICKMEVYIQHTDSNESVLLLRKGTEVIFEEDTTRLSKSYNELLNAFEARRIAFFQELDELRGMLIFQDDGIRRLQSEKRSLMQTIVDKDALIQSLQMNQPMGQLSLTSASGEEGSQSDVIKRLKDRNNVLCEAIRQSDIKIGILERDKSQQAAQLAEALETKRLIQDAYIKTQKQHSEEIVQLRQQLRESNQHYKSTPNWQFSHQDVTLSQQELGRGAFGTVRIGKFRGQSVAVKQLYAELQSPENISRMNREIDILSQLRHPNIVQFIGAILDHPDGNPRIMTEVMDTSLRKAYESKKLTPDSGCRPVILSIMHDVAVGLNYLHTLPIDNIVHRDVSSANVLLESKGPGKWKTKISDFGSANIVRRAVSRAPGAEVYSAPECFQGVSNQYSAVQTPKMDVYSYGVLFCEALTCKFPDRSSFQDMLQQVWSSTKSVGLITRSLHHELIKSCTKDNPYKRPTMNEVISKLDQLLASH
ncbi:PREDICTED: wall-associated receptor kinase-like 20 [Amphimedon queenslandica]|uniref:Protein kinase domain-containing protein n=1 Tax=Amphimedon queenslandica TaxID=400682 RepID=A0A1X7TCA4_AMPQE|nr:PREDICTED: wall-associated receptor kinase-like 20 [Amphimedon queenslandica]|eukprot:XP_019860329.1 PREDICTED: wall-associated receptor kinase-like 20 [Amphimedon queenslandica]